VQGRQTVNLGLGPSAGDEIGNFPVTPYLPICSVRSAILPGVRTYSTRPIPYTSRCASQLRASEESFVGKRRS
jgi:hypothetical protein